MVELPGWMKSLPDGVRLATDDLSSQLIERFAALTDERAAPGMRAEDQHWSIRWPRANLSVRVFPGGITEETSSFDYRPSMELLLSKHSPSGVAVWGIGAEKRGMFLSAFDDNLREWIKSELIFSPSAVLARDIDLIVVTDEQMRFSIVGAPPVLMAELDEALGGKVAIDEAFASYVDQMGVGFGAEDRTWAEKYLKRQRD